MYSTEKVQEWSQWSRESLPETGDYPLLDVAKINGTDCPWQENIYFDFQDSDKGSRDKLLALFENYLSRDPADVSGRFTALNLHYAFSMFANDDSELKTYFDVASVDHEDIREDFANNLAYLVRLLPVENCTDWRTIRWEICNACAVRDWGRARKLHDQLEALDLLEPAERQVLRGQFNFFVAFGSKESRIFHPLFWEPKLYDLKPHDSLGWERESHERTLLWACLELGRRREDDEKEITLDEAKRDRIFDAANDLQKGLAKRPDLSPAYRSMLAVCFFATDEFGNAAKNYERVLVDSNSNISLTESFKIEIFKCIANCYQLAGETEKAQDTLNRCAGEFPTGKGIYKELARIQVQATKPELALESWTKESERDEAFGEDPLASTLLALGPVWGNSDQIATRVEELISSNPQLSVSLKSLLKAHWSSMDDLTPGAQAKWICGSCMILNPTVDKIQQAHLAQAAAAQFGMAVELELKSRVFGKFRDYVYQCSGLRSLVENKRSWAKDERFFKFLVSHEPMKLPLGQMHHAFRDCKKSNRDVLREFNRWVQQNRPTLLNYQNLRVLGDICNIHNPAKHGEGISEENARKVPHLCRKFLSELLSRPKHGTS